MPHPSRRQTADERWPVDLVYYVNEPEILFMLLLMKVHYRIDWRWKNKRQSSIEQKWHDDDPINWKEEKNG